MTTKVFPVNQYMKFGELKYSEQKELIKGFVIKSFKIKEVTVRDLIVWPEQPTVAEIVLDESGFIVEADEAVLTELEKKMKNPEGTSSDSGGGQGGGIRKRKKSKKKNKKRTKKRKKKSKNKFNKSLRLS